MSIIYESSDDWLLHELYLAFLEARKGKCATIDESNFEGLNLMPNLCQLRDDIQDRVYKPSRGIAFIIIKPVPREIFAAPFRDRVVHHFLCNQSMEWWDRRFIRDSYSCRIGKGTLDAIQRLEHHIRSVSDNYSKRAFVFKFDIKGYFMSLSRQALYDRIEGGLSLQFSSDSDQWLCQLLKYVWGEIIFDDPTKGAKRKGPLSDWNKIPPEKSLFTQPEGQGIVIGNLTSQVLSNVYLDALDRFITLDLGYKHYGRYVDDFYIMAPEEQYEHVLKDVITIERFMKGKLGLTLHPRKRYIQDVRKGVAFLGAVVYPHCTVPGRRFVKNFYEAAYKCAIGEKEIESVISYLGYADQINGNKLCKNIFDNFGWAYRF